MTEERQRRALTPQGGARRASGDASLAAVLERALDAAGREPVDVLTHNFHAWPARMHPWLARVLLEELASDDTRLLDPFVGSGTTLVEAQRRGVRAVGVDLNPLARRVAEVKCRVTTEAERAAFMNALESVVEASHARVKERRPARAPLHATEVRRYEPHVLRELAGLWEEIRALPAGPDQRILEVLLSAIVVKFSKQRADTAQSEVKKQIGRHVPTGFFERRGRELVERWDAYAVEVPKGAPRPRVFEGDARKLRGLLRDQSFTMVITSPPYGGTYDYVEHHARRFPWLGLDPRLLERKEIGARRRLSQGEDAEERWQAEVRAFLSSMGDVLVPGALAILVVGDADVGGRRVDAEMQIGGLAPACGFELRAAASEERPDWSGRKRRREHLLALVRSDEIKPRIKKSDGERAAPRRGVRSRRPPR